MTPLRRRCVGVAISALVTILLPTMGYAQDSPGSIEGKVTDTGQAVLAQATLELFDSSGRMVRTATSNSDGHYHFGSVAAGSYTLRVSQSGFEAIKQGPVIVRSGAASTLDVTLNPQPVREVVYVVSEPLTDVEPTGSKLDLPPLETPATIVEMNSNTLSLRGYQQIEEAVEAMPGATSGGSPADPSQFATRGFVGNQVTLLRDGIYIGPSNMITRPQNSFNVESVDLLAGPASVLYGQGAVGGTVNVLTKPAVFDKIHYNGLLSYGSFNTYDLGFGAGGEITKQLAFRSDISYYHSDGYVTNANPAALNYTGSLLWKPSDKFTAKLALDALRDDLSKYYGTPFVSPSFGTHPLTGVLTVLATNPLNGDNTVLDSRMRFHNYNVANAQTSSTSFLPSAVLNWQPTANLSIKDEVYYFHAERHWENAEIYKFLATAGATTDENGNPNPADVIARDRFHVFHNQNLPGNQLSLVWSHKIFGLTNRFLAGYDFYNISFVRSRGFPNGGIDGFVDFVDPLNPMQGRYGNFPEEFPSRVSPTKIADHAGYFEDALDITSRFKLVTGLRGESFYLDRLNYGKDGSFQPQSSFSRTFQPLNYRAGAVYKFASFLNGYAQFSTGQDPVGSNIFLVNAGQNFDLSTSRQAEVGIKSLLPNGWGDATLAVYYIKRSNILAPVPGQPDQVETIGSQIAKGGEFSLLLHPLHNLDINFNTAYTHSRFGSFQDIATGNNYAGTQPANLPTTSTNLWVHVRQIKRIPLEFGGGLRFVGERFADNGNLTKLLSYGTVDVYGTYHLTERMAITARGRNLFDKAYAQWADIYYPTEIVLGAPRSGEVAFTFKF
jgi:iron complex outermembrane receptor protein